MIRRLVLFLLTLSLIIPAYADAATRVRGYFRKNGTYVAPHYRSNPDGIRSNNWSTRGNVNPYTGAVGTKDPGASTSPQIDWSRELFGTPAVTHSAPPLSRGGWSRTQTREYCFQRARVAQKLAEGRDLGISALDMLISMNVHSRPQTIQNDINRMAIAVYAASAVPPADVLQVMGTSCFKAYGVE